MTNDILIEQKIMHTYKLVLTDGTFLSQTHAKFPYIGAKKLLKQIHKLYEFKQEINFIIIDVDSQKKYPYTACKLHSDKEMTFNGRTFKTKYRFIIKPKLII
jgi:hypothetical protein